MITDRARQLESVGEAFIMKDFLEAFNNAGNIPAELVRWEITGEKTIAR